MAKRTGNSSVNSSIRQQTQSNAEGFSQLIDMQQASLGELSSIRKLMELSKEKEKEDKNANAGVSLDRVQLEMLSVAKDTLKGSRRFWKTRDEMDKLAYQEADKIAELARAMDTSGNFIQKLGDTLTSKKESIKDKVGIENGGLKKTYLSIFLRTSLILI